MKTDKRYRRHGGLFFWVMIITLTVVIEGPTNAQIQKSDHGVLRQDPWELMVQMNVNQELHFPLKVDQRNKPQKFNMTFPILGTPYKIKLQQYLPDLIWETVATEQKGAGGAVRLMIKGKDLEQQMWLSSDNLQRKALISPIGRVSVEKFTDTENLDQNIELMQNPEMVGVLSVQTKSGVAPREYVIKTQERITLPGSPWRLTVLDYFPHYTRDNQAKEDKNLSNQPINPALKVKLENDTISQELWLWAMFPSFTHANRAADPNVAEIPQMTFRNFNLQSDAKSYLIAIEPQGEAWIFWAEKGKIQMDKLVAGRVCPFNADYHFTVEKILPQAVLKEQWKNNTETLQRPALAVLFDDNEKQEQMVLELDKPHHVKTGTSTIVFYFKHKQD